MQPPNSLRTTGLTALLVGALFACGPASSRETASQPVVARMAEPSRTLVMVGRQEPPTVAIKALRSAGLTADVQTRVFNAALTLIDREGKALPYLAEALPELNTDSWKVFPDGTMETTYHLKPGLTWHDGEPLTAEDFAFAWRVYGTPEVSDSAGAPPNNLIDEISTPDPHTLVLHWRGSFPYAGTLSYRRPRDFPPLPRHILQQPFEQQDPDAFISLPFWSSEYVNAGPFKIDRWEPGSAIEASAFDGHVLGRPRIDRIRLIFLPDPNTVVANLLSGEAHLTIDDSIRFEQGSVLQREWTSRGGGGSVIFYPGLWRWTYVQLRPELAQPDALLDLPVRQALATSLDKAGLNDGLFDGKGLLSNIMFPESEPFYPEIDRTLPKFPYDLRRTDQLMNDAGWTKGGDGVYTHPSEGRFTSELMVIGSAQNQAEMSIMAAGWRRAGFDIKENVFGTAQARNGEARATIPGMATTSLNGGDYALGAQTTRSIPSPATRWTGNNRGGWSNAEYDRLFETYSVTLSQTERTQLLVQMAKTLMDDVPIFPLFFNSTTVAFADGLTGPQPVVLAADVSWNVYEWQFK